jgi:GT2 family glycosyltransferase
MSGTGAIIVTYNSESDIGPCLDAALSRAERVVVVDNASTDSTLQQVRARPGVTLVANPENRGFAAAVNQGAELLATPLLLLLNPDAILSSDLGALAGACAEPGVGAAAGKLTGADGRAQAGFSVRRFPTPMALAFEALGLNRLWKSNPVNRRYRCLGLDLEAPADVEQPAAAFLMVRADVFRQLGGMDPAFQPVWFEDVDFLKRLHQAGFRVRYIPSVVARHTGGGSVGRLPEGSRVAWWYGSLLRYSFKHFGPAGRLMVVAAVVCGSALRMSIGVLREWKLEPLTVYGKVIRFACLRLMSGRFGEAGGTPVLARH